MGGSCSKDTDCCGHDSSSVGVVLCETRTQAQGLQCYKNKKADEPCTAAAECFSQLCIENVCIARAPPITELDVDICELALPYLSLEYVEGHTAGECPCGSDAEYAKATVKFAVDGTSSDDVNKNSNPYGSGFIVTPRAHFPLRKMQLCAGGADKKFDPACIKVEGRLSHENEFTVIYEDNQVALPDARAKATGELGDSFIDIDLSGKGRIEADLYKVTFD